jgi:hypothetical protein
VRRFLLVILILLQVVIIWEIYATVKDADFELDFARIFDGGGVVMNLSNVKHEEPFNQSFQAAKQVRLEGFVGDVDIVYADTSDIIFEGKKFLSHTTLDMEAFDSTHIEYKIVNGTAILRWEKPRMFGGTVGFTGVVTVPRSVERLDVEVELGKVVSKGGRNSLSIRANLGDVRVDGHEGSVVINADLGAVRLKDVHPGNVLRIDADLGEIDYSGSLATNTDIRASLGSVTLRLPEDTWTNIDASVDLGSLNSDFPFTNYWQSGSKTRIDGVLGEHRPHAPNGKLTIRANLGSVNIRKVAMW